MPSFRTFVVVGASVWLLEHASGFRTEAPPPGGAGDDRDDPSKPYARCNYDGPQEGPPFHIGLSLKGYKPEQQKCSFRCEKQIREFDTAIMPNIFDAEFVPHAPGVRGGAFCKCTAHGGSRPIIQFYDYKTDHCTKSECWRKYLVALNFKFKETEKQVSRDTLQSSCLQCAEADECGDESSLVHVDDLARAIQQPSAAAAADGAPAWDEGMIREFLAAMVAENIILAGVNGTGSAQADGGRSPMAASPRAAASAVPPPEASGADVPPTLASPLMAAGAETPRAMPSSEDLRSAATASRASSAPEAPQVSTPRHRSVARETPPAMPWAFDAEAPPIMQQVAEAPEFQGKARCNAVRGPFPHQCLVVPGERGDEWIQQLTNQGCKGNQFVLKVEEGVVFAIAVPAVQGLLGEERVYAPPSAELVGAEVRWEGVDTVAFTQHFHVRKVPGGVRIGIEGLLGPEPALDYVFSGSDVQQVLPYTQGLLVRPSGSVTQFKPEQVTPNYVMGYEALPVYSYNHKPIAPYELFFSPLAHIAYHNPCGPTSVALRNLGEVSYEAPYQIQMH